MKLKIKDIIFIAVIAVATFPVLYFTMLFVTGNARIEFTSKKPGAAKDRQKLKFLKHSNRRDSLSIAQSQSFLASEKERKEVVEERKRLVKQQERINILTQELERTRTELAAERKKFEKLVARSDEVEMKRIKQLAKIYGAMRANEAAQILQTLDDNLLIKIISAIGDERQRGKIMANLPEKKAAIITKKMGKSVRKNNG